MVRLNINGKDHDVDVDPNTPLLWAIRENVGLTGTKYGCGIAQCGACTVHVDGVATRSCSFPASAAVRQENCHHRGPRPERRAAQGAEGLGRARRAAMRLLPERHDHGGRGPAQEQAEADRRDIDREITNICRCGTFQQVRAAIHAAANA
jgi:isoquinoline 1-oxidoreductase alpha subunit